MVTAPDTPRLGVPREHSGLSDVSFDGPVESPDATPKVRDFALVTEVIEIDEIEACPDCDSVSDSVPTNDTIGLGLVKQPYLVRVVPPSASVPDAPISGLLAAAPVPSREVPNPSTGLGNVKQPIQVVVAPLSVGVPNAPSSGLPIAAPVPSSEVPNLSTGLAGKDYSSALVYRFALTKVSRFSVPADITGSLDPPTLPKPSRKRKSLNTGRRAVRKGQKCARKCRRHVLRKPVLSVILGRQLAEHTSVALKHLAKGNKVDPVALKEATALAPQTVSLPA